MKRTGIVASLLPLLLAAPAPPQDGARAPAARAQADPVDDLVVAMRAAEARLRTVALELATTARLQPDVVMTTQGTLRVARGEQAAVHTRVEWRTADGQHGRVECAQTAAGILMFEGDSAFGEVFVQVDPSTVADLEWAGRVLQRDDLPGASPGPAGPGGGARQADAPLGSAMLAAMHRQFVLAVDARTDRDGERGTWLVGPRRPGLDVQDPALPVADRVEAFVRARDLALLSVRQLAGATVVQELTIGKVETDVELPPRLFEVDGGGQRLRPAQQHTPLWQQIEQAIVEAEAKQLADWHAAVAMWAFGGAPLFRFAVRPSRR